MILFRGPDIDDDDDDDDDDEGVEDDRQNFTNSDSAHTSTSRKKRLTFHGKEKTPQQVSYITVKREFLIVK